MNRTRFSWSLHARGVVMPDLLGGSSFRFAVTDDIFGAPPEP
ncbi:hypothetical protein ABZ626_35435 [Streptomyces longispororuber]